MTLIVAVRGPLGEVFVGADSAQISQEEHSGEWNADSVRKLRKVPALDVVWGWSGSDQVGAPFGWWVDGQTWEDWGAAKEALRLKVRELGEQAREGSRDPHDWHTTIVLAGYINGEPGIVSCDQNGFEVDRTDSAIFVGSGALSTKVAWTHLTTRVFSEPVDAHAFGSLIDSAVRIVPGLGTPVQLWEISANGCAESFPFTPSP